MRVLTWFGSFEDSRLPETWSIVVRNCGPQKNANDCGVFVAACAASIVLQTPAPTHVEGFRAIMASQFVAKVKGEALGWDLVKVHLEIQGEGEYGGAIEGLEDEMGEELVERHTLCEWPGCHYETVSQADMEIHLQQIHDRIMWVCPVVTCRSHFPTEEETLDHVETKHDGLSVDLPTILLESYRTFNTTELRRLRRIAERKWSMTYNSEEVEQQAIADMHAMYHHPTPRVYFTALGVLNQGKDTLCRAIR